MIDLLHIGFGKCLSSTFQEIVFQSPTANLFKPIGIITEINKIIEKNFEKNDNLVENLRLFCGRTENYDWDACFKDGKNAKVLSSEGYTFSFINELHLADFILLKQKILSEIMRGKVKNVFIIVRSPSDLIRSIYVQSIKEGGSCSSIGEYIKTHRKVLLNNMNLKQTKMYWEDQGIKVIILPMELFIKNQSDFMFRLSSASNVKINYNIAGIHLNKSQSARVSSHVSFNRISDSIIKWAKGISVDTDAVFALEKYKLLFRGFIDGADHDNFQEVENLFIQNDVFHDYKIDEGMLRYLTENYIEVLEDYFSGEFAEIIEKYKNNISLKLN